MSVSMRLALNATLKEIEELVKTLEISLTYSSLDADFMSNPLRN